MRIGAKPTVNKGISKIEIPSVALEVLMLLMIDLAPLNAVSHFITKRADG